MSRPCWPAGLWPAFADANQLENAVINLAVNARDAMPDGGRLTIETSNAYLDEELRRTSSAMSRRASTCMLSVSRHRQWHSARGAATRVRAVLHDQGRGKGSGLGPRHGHGFVKQSGGHIRIYSEDGHGTTVKIYLPRLSQAEEVAATAAPASPPPWRRARRAQETILLVEDNDGVRAYTKSALEELGYRVLRGGRCRAGPARARGRSRRIDLLFTDVVLPGGISGRELADRRSCEQQPGCPVLFTTGYTRNAIIHHGRLDPNVNLLSKPYTQQDLARKIRQLLD